MPDTAPSGRRAAARPDPRTFQTVAEFQHGLRDLIAWAGTNARRTADASQRNIAPTTVHDNLSRSDRLATAHAVEWIVRGCVPTDEADEEVDKWLKARDRIATATATDPNGHTTRPTGRSEAPAWWRAVVAWWRVLSGVRRVLLAGGVTVGLLAAGGRSGSASTTTTTAAPSIRTWFAWATTAPVRRTRTTTPGCSGPG